MNPRKAVTESALAQLNKQFAEQQAGRCGRSDRCWSVWWLRGVYWKA